MKSEQPGSEPIYTEATLASFIQAVKISDLGDGSGTGFNQEASIKSLVVFPVSIGDAVFGSQIQDDQIALTE